MTINNTIYKKDIGFRGKGEMMHTIVKCTIAYMAIAKYKNFLNLFPIMMSSLF